MIYTLWKRLMAVCTVTLDYLCSLRGKDTKITIKKKKQDMPCTYNVTINTECVTMEKQQCVLITIVVEQRREY